MGNISQKNLARVKQWFEDNPTGTGKQCAHDLGLGTGTVSNARKLLGIAPGHRSKNVAANGAVKEKGAHMGDENVQNPEGEAAEARERMTLMIRPSVREKLQHMVALQGKGRGGIADVIEELTNEAFPVWAERFINKYAKGR